MYNIIVYTILYYFNYSNIGMYYDITALIAYILRTYYIYIYL